MKQLLFISTLVILSTTLHSQDLIVTAKGDSINCNISKIKADNIYFTFKYEDEFRSTLLPISNIEYHQIDYFQEGEVPVEKMVGYQHYPHFRIAMNSGYSYRTAKVPENMPADIMDYYKALKSGFHFGGELTYYFTEPLGFGIKYYTFHSANSMDGVYFEDTEGNGRLGTLSDDIIISFIGPTFSTRLLNHNKRNALVMNLSLGYLGYSNSMTVADDYKVTGKTVGLVYDIGYDIGISENVSMGFQISAISGMLYEYTMNDNGTARTIELEEGEYEGLGRIDFSVGLRFCK